MCILMYVKSVTVGLLTKTAHHIWFLKIRKCPRPGCWKTFLCVSPIAFGCHLELAGVLLI